MKMDYWKTGIKSKSYYERNDIHTNLFSRFTITEVKNPNPVTNTPMRSSIHGFKTSLSDSIVAPTKLISWKMNWKMQIVCSGPKQISHPMNLFNFFYFGTPWVLLLLFIKNATLTFFRWSLSMVQRLIWLLIWLRIVALPSKNPHTVKRRKPNVWFDELNEKVFGLE